ncbi:hypothetical protein TSUD_180780 [Trifolium subterraneum]|uniref:J domain-containing protein n=1 Tax=Trifolium subterraneum TaxID=3900 RepID=A0A2Z6PBX0_TRISU|nr:hypothetical protein TSUD_180780 [Trifolium subterraneum]
MAVTLFGNTSATQRGICSQVIARSNTMAKFPSSHDNVTSRVNFMAAPSSTFSARDSLRFKTNAFRTLHRRRGSRFIVRASKDYYTVLGVSKNSTKSEIKTDATKWSEAIQSSEAQSRSERLKLFRDSEEFRSSRMFRGLQEFRGCLIVMSHSEDEYVQKLNCEGLSEANLSKTNQTPSYQRFIRSKGIRSHQRATSTTTYQA